MTADDIALGQLPAPVTRYLEMALSAERRPIDAARLTQTGMLRTDARSPRWMNFEAVHEIAPSKTEFKWTAHVAALPFVHIQVQDSYANGRGSGQVKLFSLLRLARREGGDAMNSGSLHRYLAEAVWYPTALLPRSNLRWSAISETRALATLAHGDTTVSLEFRFSPTGEVSGIYSPGRWGLFGGQFKRVPWEGHFSEYQLIGGVRIPRCGEVGWHLDGAWHCIWKGKIIDAIYEFGA